MRQSVPLWSAVLALLIGLGVGLMVPTVRPTASGFVSPHSTGGSCAWTIYIDADPNLKQPAWTDQGDLESPRDYYLFRDPAEAAAAKRAARGLLTDHFSRLLLER